MLGLAPEGVASVHRWPEWDRRQVVLCMIDITSSQPCQIYSHVPRRETYFNHSKVLFDIYPILVLPI